MRENMNRYVKGYLKDPTFEGHWKESPSTVDELITSHQFYKNKDGLLVRTSSPGDGKALKGWQT